MRLIARIPDERQVGALVDSLKNIGLDRSNMVISSIGKEQIYNNVEEATAGGILVAVEISKHNSNRVRAIMEESGAAEIIQD